MPGGAPGANEIGGDYRFAVAWLKRVQSAKPDGNGQSEGHHAKAEVLGRDEVSKGAARRGHGCSSAESLAGSGRGCVSWRYDVREPRLPEAYIGLQHLRWALQEFCGIVGQSLTTVGSGHGALEYGDRRIGHRNDLLPAEPSWEIGILVMEMARGIDTCGLKGCLVHNPKPERRQLTSARRKDDLATHRLEREALVVHLYT